MNRLIAVALVLILNACGGSPSSTKENSEVSEKSHALSAQQQVLERAKSNANALEAAAQDQAEAIDAKQRNLKTSPLK